MMVLSGQLFFDKASIREMRGQKVAGIVRARKSRVPTWTPDQNVKIELCLFVRPIQINTFQGVQGPQKAPCVP